MFLALKQWKPDWDCKGQMFCRCHSHIATPLWRTVKRKSGPILNFAHFDSLVCFVARSWEKSRSLSLAPFVARCRSLSLSVTGLGIEATAWARTSTLRLRLRLYKLLLVGVDASGRPIGLEDNARSTEYRLWSIAILGYCLLLDTNYGKRNFRYRSALEPTFLNILRHRCLLF